MIIKNNSILYFSGTGNTYDVASKVSKNGEFELINISTLIEEEVLEINCEILGIAFPVYYAGIPRLMNNTIRKMKFKRDQYVFALANYGGGAGNPFKILDSKLNEKDACLGSGFLMNMPGNYICRYDAREKSVQIKNFKKVESRIDDIRGIVLSKKVVHYEKSRYIVDRVFSRNSEKKVESLAALDVNFSVDDKCNNCKICLRVCPVKNIEIKDNKVKWLGKCEQCMACIQHCPKEAIQYGDKTYKRKRYTNPNVNYLKVLLDN